MNVLHIHGYDYGGGAETVFNITRRNKLSGCNYSGYCQVNPDNIENSDIRFELYTKYPFPINIFTYMYSENNYIELKKFLECSKIDVIHLHGFIGALSPSILSAIKKYKKKNRILIVQTMHDFNIICPNSMLFNFNSCERCEKCIKKIVKYPVLFQNCDRRGRIYSFLKGLRSIIANNMIKHYEILDVIVAPSFFMKDKLVEGGLDSRKIRVVRNPVLLSLKEISEKKDIFCYFGRFSKEKNIEFIISAFSQWKKGAGKNFILLLVGDGDEKRRLKSLAEKSEARDSIRFYDFMPHDELNNLLSEAKYFIMASKWYENAPMSILEAASLDILPLVPDLGGMKETVESVIRAGKVYLSDNADSLCESISALEADYEGNI